MRWNDFVFVVELMIVLKETSDQVPISEIVEEVQSVVRQGSIIVELNLVAWK